MADDKGDQLWIGPIGPIEITDDNDIRRVAARNAAHIAQSAINCDDLVNLVLHHPNALVRDEAVPRLKARFADVPVAQDALVRALSDRDEGVRCAAISAVSDLQIPGVGDRLASALHDAQPDVRYFAAIALQRLGDRRAPADPESFAYGATDS